MQRRGCRGCADHIKRFSSLVSTRPGNDPTMNELLNPKSDEDIVPISTGHLRGVEFDIAVTGRPDEARQEIAFTVRLQRVSSKGLDDEEGTQVCSKVNENWEADTQGMQPNLMILPADFVVLIDSAPVQCVLPLLPSMSTTVRHANAAMVMSARQRMQLFVTIIYSQQICSGPHV